MEYRLNEAFDKLKMSDECAERISNSFNRTAPRRIRFSPIAVAASLLLVIFVFTNSTAVQALEAVGESIVTAVTSLFYPDASVEEQYEFEGGDLIVERGTNSDGEKYNTVQYNTTAIPSWLEFDENGLFFTGNDERIEISNLISDEIPFTYVMTDANNIRHYIIVGGVYGTGENPLENVGWAEWMQKAPYDFRSWLGGYSKGDGAWYNTGREVLEIIPWGRN